GGWLKTRAGSAPERTAVQEAPLRLAAGPLSRTELEQRLTRLAETPPPETLSTGAKCYKPAMPPKTADYVCPKDGSRTQYSLEAEDGHSMIKLLQFQLPAMRRMLSEVVGLEARLDESEFCKKCNPGRKDPQLVLVVTLPGDKPGQRKEHRVRGLGFEDVKLLQELFAGKLAHEGDYGRETPLKDHLPRLRELLGFEPQAKQL
ncbi:MAG TPA: hypothetical protein P5076_16115, partial [Myxococcota bacterium]|nr:hypothetical protein [Myxococcota bacterium]